MVALVVLGRWFARGASLHVPPSPAVIAQVDPVAG